MVFNCQVFPASPFVSAMIPAYGAADGGECHLPLCMNSSASLNPHIKPRHAPLSPPFNARVWEY